MASKTSFGFFITQGTDTHLWGKSKMILREQNTVMICLVDSTGIRVMDIVDRSVILIVVLVKTRT